jgi:hypothetical protein
MKKTSFTSSDYSCWFLPGLTRSSSPFKYLQMLILLVLGANSTYGQIGPNCTHINASIGADDTARILVGELVTNATQIQAQGDSLTIEILGSYGQRIYYVENVGPGYELALYACPHIGRQLKVNASITGSNGSTCWSYLTFKQGNGPTILGRSKTVYCFDPLVKGGHIHDVPPQAIVPCRGSEPATFVADWVTPFDCDAALLGTEGNDTAKIIYREYEAFDKDGVRGAGFDTIYVLRLPQITVDNAFCPERDTVYCGQGGKIGPYMVAGYSFEYGAGTPIDRYQAISFIETKYNPTTRQLEFYPADFDPKCGISVHVDAWPLGSGECSSQYKVNVEIKQTCWGTPGLYMGPGSSDVVDFAETYHPKHWEYTRSKTSGYIWANGTNLGTVSAFDGSFNRPNPELKLIDAAGATDYTLYNGTGSSSDYARMCVRIPTEGDLSFTIAGSNGSNAGYRLNGVFVPLANGAYTLSLEPCDLFCFESRGAIVTVSALNWVETVLAAPLDSIAPGYWRCEFWVIDLDTLPPVVECDLDAKANSNLVHEDTLYIPAGTHECAAHAYLPPVYVEDDWSGVKFVKAIVPGIATVVFEKSATIPHLYESHKQVKIPHGGAIPIYYEAYDSCHNIGYDTCWVKVKDYTKPVAICDKGVTVGLSSKKVWVDASTFDEGSWDNCGVNLLLARRVDWYEACIDLCDDYVWCCTNEHYDTLYCSKLETDKHIDEVEAHYAKYLEWLCNDYVECGPIIYNAWQYALTKYATLECIDHPYEVNDHYFKQLFKECYSAYRYAYGYTRAENYSGNGVNSVATVSGLNGLKFNDLDDSPDVEYYCFDNFKQLPGAHPGEYNFDAEIDLYEQIGGGWSDAVPFDCEDACSEVTVELLVMDYWCNWSKCWTKVLVEDKTPVQVEHEVDPQIEITCAAYKGDLYSYPGVIDPVSVEWIVEAAKEGDAVALGELDKIFGGYEKVWRDEYGNVPAPNKAHHYDLYCYCKEYYKQEKVWDEHLGYIWKTVYYDSCYYHHDIDTTYYGQVVVNCSQAIQCEQKVWCSFDHCGQGYIYREWKFIPGCPPVEGHYGSGHSLDTVKRKQLIWVGSNCELEKGMFTKPGDVYVSTCGIEYDDAGNAAGVLSPEYTGYPEYLFDDDCRIVGTTYQDKVFKIVGGDEACYKIIRTWYHIDWCYLGGKPENATYWWLEPEYEGRKIKWEQKIIVVDTVPPVCTFEEELETVEAAGCAYTLNQTVHVDDSCGALNYHWTLSEVKGSSKTVIASDQGDLDGTSTSFEITVSDLLTGSYELKVRVTDECQNENYCVDVFDVITGKKPAAICITSLTAELTPMDLDQDGEIDTAMVTIWANEFDRSSKPACNSDDELSFRIELLDEVDDDDFIGDADSLVLGCDQVGTQRIRLWVIDEKGSFDYCDVILVVQNNMGGCGDFSSTNGSITGSVKNELQQTIKDVQVRAQLQDGKVLEYLTTASGAYAFATSLGQDVKITPVKNVDPMNGISTLDLVKIQKHILAKEKLENEYREIAADVNNDGRISTLDLVQLRKLILGKTDAFQDNNSWRFFEKSTNKESYSINSVSNAMQLHWMGVKVGDVNLDADSKRSAGRSANHLVFNVEDVALSAGNQYAVNFRAGSFEDITGYQFTLQFDPATVRVANIIPGEAISLTDEHFASNKVERGIITSSWNASEGTNVKEGEVLFTLIVEAVGTAQLSDAIAITSSVTKAEAYNSEDKVSNVALNFQNLQVSEDVFALFQNSPNPFTEETNVGFNLPKADFAKITVYDMTGKVIHVVSGDFAKGYNSVQIKKSDISVNGLLYYQLDTEAFTATKKMIHIR